MGNGGQGGLGQRGLPRGFVDERARMRGKRPICLMPSFVPSFMLISQARIVIDDRITTLLSINLGFPKRTSDTSRVNTSPTVLFFFLFISIIN